MLEKNEHTGKWLPLSEVQKMFNYRPTQMGLLLKNKAIKVAKVGKRKFVWSSSLDDFLESHAN